METVKENALASLTIDQVLSRIRIDPDTGRGSVIDVVELITGKPHAALGVQYTTLHRFIHPV